MPMFTRRHYVAIAEILADLRRDPLSLVSSIEIDRVRDSIAARFTRDNPRFDRARFAVACDRPDTVTYSRGIGVGTVHTRVRGSR